MPQVHKENPLKALVVCNKFNRMQADILKEGGFSALNFTIKHSCPDGAFPDMPGIRYVRGPSEIAVTTDINPALFIAANAKTDVIVTAWDAADSAQQTLIRLAKDLKIPVVTLDHRPLTETILMMAGTYFAPPPPSRPPAHRTSPQKVYRRMPVRS